MILSLTRFTIVFFFALLLATFSQAYGQISANGHLTSVPTVYTDGSPNDSIYIYCEGSLGSLTATMPGAQANWAYEWFSYDYSGNTFGTSPIQSGTGVSNTITGLNSGGYQVSIRDGGGVVQGCFIAWVFVDSTIANITPLSASCDSTRTYASVINKVRDFTYFNPPPEQFIIDANTFIEVEFQAVHTYVSDLAYYLVGPPSCGNPTIQLGDELCCCNSGNDVASLTFSTSSNAIYDVCILPVPIAAGPFGRFGANGVPPTNINWAGIYGCNAVDGGWAVQIYDCVGLDVGALTRATLTFSTNTNTSCGPSQIVYDSGPINSTINDNSCSAASASIFQVPINPLVTTPIVLSNSITSIQWSTNNPSVTINNASTANPTFQGLNSAQFTELYLTVTDNFGCVKRDTFTNEFIFPRAMTATVPGSVCLSFGQVNLTATPPGGTWSGTGITNPSGTFDPAVAGIGIHTLTYNTGNNCDTVRTEQIEVAPNLVSTWTAPDTLCNPSATYNLNNYLDPAAATGGRWTGPGVTQDSLFTPGNFGNYTLQYYVAFNDTLCADSSTNTIIVAPTMRIPTIGAVDVSCFGGNDGMTFATAAGGQAPYTFTWDDPGTQVNDTAFNLTAGTYAVVATDLNGCTATDTVQVNEPTQLVINLGMDSVECHGGSSGRAWVSYSGGTPPYSVAWNGPGSQTTDTATNLVTGTYTVVVTDDNGCSETDSILVPEPAAMVLTMDSTDALCFDSASGSTGVFVSGGTTPYSYLWNDPNNQTSSNATGLTAGTYSVIVTDANNCTVQGTTTVGEPAALQLQTTMWPTSCAFGSDGWAAVSASGATTPYSYLWNDPGSQTTDTAVGLTAGIYTVTVTDDNGCRRTSTIQVTQPPSISLNLSSTPTRCPNSAGGTATVSVQSGGIAPFSYAWNDANNQTTQTAVNLLAGLYTVTVTDDSGCTASDTVTVGTPNPLTTSTAQTNVSCFGLSDGSATVNASGGTTPYSYQWNDTANSTTPTISNLSAGVYIVEAQDDSNCIVLDTVTITQPQKVSLTSASFDASCSNSNDGIAFVTPSGGTQPFSFAWNDPANQTNDTAFNLAPGNYQVVATDVNGCDDTATFSIGSPPPIVFLQLLTSDPICFGDNTGRAVLIAGGGTPGYSYNWSDPNNQTTPIASGLTSGTFTVTITDSEGCTADSTFTLNDPPAIQGFVVSTTPPTCAGQSNGSFAIGQNNGTPPYRYLLNGVGQSSPTFLGMAAGNYVIIVADSNNCSDSVSVTVGSPTPLTISTQVIDVTCNGYNDGQIVITAAGGTLPYQYRNQFNNYQNNNTLNGLAPNTYHVTVRDSNGCIASDSFLVVSEPLPFTFTVEVDSLSCPGSDDGRILVSTSGGVPPYDSYSITPDGVNFNSQSSPIFSGLAAGTYSITALDGNNCPFTVQNIDVFEPAFNIFSDTVIGTSCYGEEHQDGAIFVNGIGDNPPFQFSIDGGPFISTNVFRNLGAGPHQIVGQDTKGCKDTFTITVPQPDPIVVIINPPIDTIELGDAIQLSTTVINANGPLDYDWTPSIGLNCTDCPNPIVSVYESTDYFLTVTDLDKPNRAVPCTGEARVTIVVLPPKPTFVPNTFTPNGDGFNDVLLVYGKDIARIDLNIFNRWGELVFVSETQSLGWDGTYKGELVPPGVYAYQLLVTYLDGSEELLKGTITLLR
jgi:gliding motility-associated-like protein